MTPTVFIVTDPCYCIHDHNEWNDLLNATKWFEDDDNYPLQVNKDVVFHSVESTADGDGSLETEEWKIAVDSGLLCVAEISQTEYETNHQRWGVVFPSLIEAYANFRDIMNEFNRNIDDDEEEDDYEDQFQEEGEEEMEECS